MINYAQPSISKSDIRCVNKVLNSKNLTQGQETEKFEKNFSNFINSDYSVTFNSCTSALIAACKSLDLKYNDEVWTTPNTFVASSNSAVLCGANIKFIDINPDTFNMSLDELEIKLKNTPKKKLPKIIISVHFGGLVGDQKKIWKLSKKYKFKIIEDCCHALGGKNEKNLVGNCRYSHISVFSFHAIKAITTGEGGMATTNNKDLFEKLKFVRSHGITRDKKKFILKNKNNLHYEQQTIGYNFRMTDFQAALGNNQLKRLKKFIRIRNKIANLYIKKLSNLPIKFQKYKKNKIIHAYHIFVIRFENFNLRNSFYDYMLKNKIKCSFHYPSIYSQPYYKKKFKQSKCKEMEKYEEDAITLPIFPNLKLVEQEKIIKFVIKFFKKNDFKYIK